MTAVYSTLNCQIQLICLIFANFTYSHMFSHCSNLKQSTLTKNSLTAYDTDTNDKNNPERRLLTTERPRCYARGTREPFGPCVDPAVWNPPVMEAYDTDRSDNKTEKQFWTENPRISPKAPAAGNRPTYLYVMVVNGNGWTHPYQFICIGNGNGRTPIHLFVLDV